MSFITSALAAIRGVVEIYKDLKTLISFYQKEVRDQWYAESFKTIEAIKNAKTDEERAALAKKLAEGGLLR